MVYFTPPELFLVKLRLALVAGLVVCLPLVVPQVLLFLFPALYARERRRAAFFLVMALVFAAGGALFAYRIALPALLGFFAAFDHAQIDAVFDLQQYVRFTANTTVAIALGFESPVVVWFLGASEQGPRPGSQSAQPAPVLPSPGYSVLKLPRSTSSRKTFLSCARNSSLRSTMVTRTVLAPLNPVTE